MTKRCTNCSTAFRFGQRKCQCGASVKFARCETVEESKARQGQENQIDALLAELMA